MDASERPSQKSPMKPFDPHTVYFIEAIGANAIKIGCIERGCEFRIMMRITVFQVGCPFELKLLGTTGRHREERLHFRFAKDHIRGEWFRASLELRDFIQAKVKGNSPSALAKRRIIELEKSE